MTGLGADAAASAPAASKLGVAGAPCEGDEWWDEADLEGDALVLHTEGAPPQGAAEAKREEVWALRRCLNLPRFPFWMLVIFGLWTAAAVASAAYLLWRWLTRSPDGGCDTLSSYALCQWPDHFAGASDWGYSLEIQKGNPLWVDPDDPRSQKEMEKTIQYLASSVPHRLSAGVCEFFEERLPRIGLNGLMKFVEALNEVALDLENPQAEAEVWGLRLHGSQVAPAFRELAADWKHVLGAYAVARRPLLDVTPLGTEADFTTPARAPFLTNVRRAGEVAGSLRLGGGPLHAVVWTAMLARLRAALPLVDLGDARKDKDGLAPGAMAAVYWKFALDHVCKRFEDEGLRSLFVHCIHGLGHGAMVVSILFDMNVTERQNFEDASECDQIVSGTTELVVRDHTLDEALQVCKEGRTRQLQYICAGGLFMEYWKTVPTEPEEDEEEGCACDLEEFSAVCFRFWEDQPAVGEILEPLQKARRGSSPAIVEPCTQSVWASKLRKPLEGLALRGCIMGLAFRLYPVFDDFLYRTIPSRPEEEVQLQSLVRYCSWYAPSDVAATSKHEASKIRSYGHWLACIAGCMTTVAFSVEADGLNGTVVERHCAQLPDARARRLCFEIGMSRERRPGLQTDDLNIWPEDVLEHLDLSPTS